MKKIYRKLGFLEEQQIPPIKSVNKFILENHISLLLSIVAFALSLWSILK